MSFYPKKYKEFEWVKEKKYTIHDIINICDFFNFPIKRRKKSLMIEDCYSYLKQGCYASRIQRYWKNRWVSEFRKTQGPACFNRKICNNSEDFLTTETMSEIDYYFFISK